MVEGPFLSSKIESLTNMPVSVENIAAYEEIVSNGFIDIVDQATALYSNQERVKPEHTRDFEDTAFKKLGLPAIDSTLEVLQSRIDMVRAAGSFITEQATKVDSIITPPDGRPLPIPGENPVSKFEEIELKDRLQTALYVVQKLGVDLSSLKLMEGQIDPRMYRQTSYYTLVVPSVDKVLQVCDEERNASYIFSSKVMEEIGLTVEALNDFTKDEKNELIRLYREKGLGHRFIYSKDWAENVESLLESTETDFVEMSQARYEAETKARPEKAPVAPEDYLSIGGLANKLGVTHKLISNIIKRQGLQLDTYLFSGRTVPGIPPAVQALIEAQPEVTTPKAPADVVSVKRFAIEIGIDREGLDRIIVDEKIPTPDYKFRGMVAPGLSAEDQERVRQKLDSIAPLALEGTVTVEEFAGQQRVDHKKVLRMASELGIEVSSHRFRKIGGGVAPGLTAEQQAKLKEHSYLRVPFATDDITSLSKLGRRLNSSLGHITHLVEELGIEPRKYRFYGQVTLGLDKAQGDQVVALFRRQGPLREDKAS